MEEEKLIAAASFIMRELESNKKLSDEAMKILADLGTKLSSVTKIYETKDEDDEVSHIKERLDSIEDKVMTWEVNPSMIWDCGPDESKEYLMAVDEARRLVESLESFNPSKDDEEHKLLRKANDVLHISMPKIEALFRRILLQNKQNIEYECLSSWSSKDDGIDGNSLFSFGDDSVDDLIQGDVISKGAEVYIKDLINPAVIPELTIIANLMCSSNYGKECSQAFISIRKDALDDFLFILDVEKSSSEDVLKMEWGILNSKIRRWAKSMRIFVRVYLASEKFLCETIFGQGESISSFCFHESSKASVIRLLSFTEAIAVGPHQPERLFRILDVYETLADLTPDIESLYPDYDVLYSRREFHDMLNQVGVCVKAIFLEVKNTVGSNVVNAAFPGGKIHHQTRFVMDYFTKLIDYSNSLYTILKDHGEGDYQDLENDNINQNSYLSPMGLHFRSLMSILESNLERNSRLYKEDALGHLFLMNNIHYMTHKVKGSELRNILGEGWIRNHIEKFQEYAMSYERTTWSSTLNLLRDEGRSGQISKTLVKKRLQGFYTMFEKIYKNQTGWSIPNTQLCEELRIATSEEVIQVYQTFINRHANNISEKHIKYTAKDLEKYIFDLFACSSRSLPSSGKKLFY